MRLTAEPAGLDSNFSLDVPEAALLRYRQVEPVAITLLGPGARHPAKKDVIKTNDNISWFENTDNWPLRL